MLYHAVNNKIAASRTIDLFIRVTCDSGKASRMPRSREYLHE